MIKGEKGRESRRRRGGGGSGEDEEEGATQGGYDAGDKPHSESVWGYKAMGL